MSNLKLRALAGVCALLGASNLAAASAHATTTINGGGSSLLAPYWSQAVDCFDSDNTTYFVKGVPVTTATPLATTPVCGPTTGTIINFDSTGSGTGQLGLFAHDAVIGTGLDAQGGFIGASSALDFGTKIGGGNDTLGNPNVEVFASIQYGLSDNSLVGTDLATYDKGTGGVLTTTFNGDSATFTAPSTYQGATFVSGASTHNGGTNSTVYPIPLAVYGPLVQFPASIDPVALAYNPTYKSSNGNTYSFNIQVAPTNDTTNTNGGLPLDQAAYCKIFTGQITDWGDPALKALNNNVSLKNTADNGTAAPITIVGRSDSSGTTSIFTRHLAAVCGSISTAFGSAGATTLPSAVTSLSNFVPGNGSSGVASAIHNAPGAIGYLGPDFALPFVNATGANTFGLNVAGLKNAADGNFYEPTPATALTAFGTLLPPQSDSSGNFNAATTSDRRDPTQWVQSTASSSALANPAATTAAAYPIVGTSNFIAYTCYASSTSVTALINFFNHVGTNAGEAGILSNAGLAALPGAWQTAISQTFLAPTATGTNPTKPLKLFFATAGSGSTNSNCTSVTGG